MGLFSRIKAVHTKYRKYRIHGASAIRAARAHGKGYNQRVTYRVSRGFKNPY